ncbi:hypothetical protein FQZ97_1155600 [compost metagenome]
MHRLVVIIKKVTLLSVVAGSVTIPADSRSGVQRDLYTTIPYRPPLLIFLMNTGSCLYVAHTITAILPPRIFIPLF